jgi:hypothetical protein
VSKFRNILNAANSNPEVEEAEAENKEAQVASQVQLKPEQKKTAEKPYALSEVENVADTKLELTLATAKEPKKGRPKGKRSDPDFEQVTAYIKSQTYTSVRIELLKEGQKREFSQLIQQLLDDWLQERD